MRENGIRSLRTPGGLTIEVDLSWRPEGEPAERPPDEPEHDTRWDHSGMVPPNLRERRER